MAAAGITRVRVGEFAWSRLEPSPGEFSTAWLSRALDVLSRHGLGVIMCTPTATPPKWLVDAMPDMLALDENGNPRRFGSRRHYCFSHPGYREACREIVTRVADEYGRHPGVVAWQTDNEYGCHDTVESFSPAALAAFRAWLSARYEDIARLNSAWGTVFWSMEYRDFDEVDLPNLTVTEANPAHRLDFQRFCSEQVRSFNALQVDILRATSPGRDIVHDFMGQFNAFDHYAVGADLDVATWNAYPLGFLQRSPASNARKRRYLRTGDPDLQAFHHDLYRACGKGRFGVMEQQPGPVNWAPSNPLPHENALALWTWEAFAHGAELVSYFRWRQVPFAQEQFHAGLNLPDGSPDRGYASVCAIATDMARILADRPAGISRAPVALVYAYEAQWMNDIQPQGACFDHFTLTLEFYRALRRHGVDIDVISDDAAIDGYDLVVIPSLPHVPDGLARQLSATEQRLVVGPRTGSKTQSLSISPALAPGPLDARLGVRIERVESLPADVPIAFQWNEKMYRLNCWRETGQTTGASVGAACEDGETAVWRNGKASYIAGWPNAEFLYDWFAAELDAAGVSRLPLAPGVRARGHRDLKFLLNYNTESVSLSDSLTRRHFVLGGATIAPGGVSAYTL